MIVLHRLPGMSAREAALAGIVDYHPQRSNPG
jgi:hypothetical protein